MTQTLHRLIDDGPGVAFTLGFVDRVARPDDHRAAAQQLQRLRRSGPLPAYLSTFDRFLLRAGARLAPRLPAFVMPLARRRMRQLVGHLVIDAEPSALAQHLRARREQGFAQNVNLLGEAVLGEGEADRRLQATVALVDQPHVDYVSIKVSSIASQLNYWDWDGSIERVVDRLRILFRRAAATDPVTFINLDMEEYHDLELTIEAFTRLLDEPEFFASDAGLVLQAYLPDSFDALRRVVDWASDRKERGGGPIKIRLVKGANLSMERVDASIHGWEKATYSTKAEVDANYKRCLDWVLRPNRTTAVRIGVASHNLFDVAWAHLLAADRGVSGQIDFEMLQGMAPAQARVVKAEAAGRMLLYTPIVADEDFDVAIGYLFRRLEETTAKGNFLHSLPELSAGDAAFEAEAERFRTAVNDRWSVSTKPQRTQPRPALGAAISQQPQLDVSAVPPFVNEPDTDPALATNRAWATQVLATRPAPLNTPMLSSRAEVSKAVARAKAAAAVWGATGAAERRRLVHRIGDELARRRGDLISVMVHESGKTFAEADPEVSEAIDFARYYGDRALELETMDDVRFEPLGVVTVVPPWNFPVAIPAGGVLAALAAGNAVILKPAPETPRCAEIVGECCAAVGLPADVCQFVRTPDDDLGRKLVTASDGVILTGSSETAQLFADWKPSMQLFAETSGKNATIITPFADIDLAVADLIQSAFGHSGQKCSATSLAICVDSVYTSPRFRRQLVDAVRSLQVGRSDLASTSVGPTITPPSEKLRRALTELDAGEEWLVTPEQLDERGLLWRPGIRLGVQPGSWFQQTECFGPVLGLISAPTLDHAIAIQNQTEYGLTGGLHSLDNDEVERWLEAVEVGNAYVNRSTTGAMVQRQPFGGWKRSSVGPGGKAGGPNYVLQLGRWHPRGAAHRSSGEFLEAAANSDTKWWTEEYATEHDPTGLFCEANVFRYCPLPKVAIRVGGDAPRYELDRVVAAAEVCGVEVIVSHSVQETVEAFMTRLESEGIPRVRTVGSVSEELRVECAKRLVYLADDPVTANGRLELRHYVREQAISRTLHRNGNIT